MPWERKSGHIASSTAPAPAACPPPTASSTSSAREARSRSSPTGHLPVRAPQPLSGGRLSNPRRYHLQAHPPPGQEGHREAALIRGHRRSSCHLPAPSAARAFPPDTTGRGGGGHPENAPPRHIRRTSAGRICEISYIRLWSFLTLFRLNSNSHTAGRHGIILRLSPPWRHFSLTKRLRSSISLSVADFRRHSLSTPVS